MDALIELLTHCLGLEKKEQDFLTAFFNEQLKF